MTKKNVDLMLEVRNYIQDHPEQHDQDSFEWPGDDACGTTRCIAGWAIFLAANQSSIHEYCRSLGTTRYGLFITPPDVAARDPLGLTNAEANRLFYNMDEGAALDLLDEYIEQGRNES